MHDESGSKPIVLLRVRRKRSYEPQNIIALQKLTNLSIHPDSVTRDIKRSRHGHHSDDTSQMTVGLQSLSMEPVNASNKGHSSSGFIQDQTEENHGNDQTRFHPDAYPDNSDSGSHIPALKTRTLFRHVASISTKEQVRLESPQHLQEWYTSLHPTQDNTNGIPPTIAVFDALHERSFHSGLDGGLPHGKNEQTVKTNNDKPIPNQHDSTPEPAVLDVLYRHQTSLQPIDDSTPQPSQRNQQTPHHSSSLKQQQQQPQISRLKPPPPRRHPHRDQGVSQSTHDTLSNTMGMGLHLPVSMLDPDTLHYLESRKYADSLSTSGLTGTHRTQQDQHAAIADIDTMDATPHADDHSSLLDADSETETDTDSVFDLYQMCPDDSHGTIDGMRSDHIENAISTQELQYLVQEVMMDLHHQERQNEPSTTTSRSSILRMTLHSSYSYTDDGYGGVTSYNDEHEDDHSHSEPDDQDLDGIEVDYPSSGDDDDDDDDVDDMDENLGTTQVTSSFKTHQTLSGHRRKPIRMKLSKTATVPLGNPSARGLPGRGVHFSTSTQYANGKSDDDDSDDHDDDVDEYDMEVSDHDYIDQDLQDYVLKKQHLYREHIKASLIRHIQQRRQDRDLTNSVWWLGSAGNNHFYQPSHLPDAISHDNTIGSNDDDESNESDSDENDEYLPPLSDFVDISSDDDHSYPRYPSGSSHAYGADYSSDDDDDIYGGTNPFFMYARNR